MKRMGLMRAGMDSEFVKVFTLQYVMAYVITETLSRVAREMTINQEITALRNLLGRQPTFLEVLYYENQVWQRGLDQWWRDRQQGYWKIHDFVWGK